MSSTRTCTRPRSSATRPTIATPDDRAGAPFFGRRSCETTLPSNASPSHRALDWLLPGSTCDSIRMAKRLASRSIRLLDIPTIRPIPASPSGPVSHVTSTKPDTPSALPLPPLPAQPRPVLEPLLDLALETALDRVVERVAADLVRPIVLPAESVGRVVIVLISCAIAFALHEPRRSVEDGLRRR